MDLPDPLIVKGPPGKEYVDPWGVQRDLEALATDEQRIIARPVGLITGNGLAPSSGGVWANLGGVFLFTYTPPVRMAGRLEWSARFDTSLAAWNYVYTRCLVTPTPPVQLTTGTGAGGSLLFLHSAGPFGGHSAGFDYVELVAGITYTFQVQATQGAAGAVIWVGSWENVLLGTFWPG